ncbi:3586_t:CDS:2 [Paraglomus occultum]|uniref:3586_t:CDS:1 n=1 Tax=Paraglomus occultum TaxID=144539 RepID=A0A9N8WNB0_9GLOM|nr:3586_t:CDS:2 [Paraglomus occultum]
MSTGSKFNHSIDLKKDQVLRHLPYLKDLQFLLLNSAVTLESAEQQKTATATEMTERLK